MSPSSAAIGNGANGPLLSRASDALLDAYVNAIADSVSIARAWSRRLKSTSDVDAIISASPKDNALTIQSGIAYYIAAGCGGGKTTTVRIFAACALGEMPQRIPIFVNLKNGVSFADGIVGAIHPAVPQIVDEKTLLSWMKVSPTLLIVDDWHQLLPQQRSEIERFLLLHLARYPIAIVISGSVEETVPNIGGLCRFVLEPYTDTERATIFRSHFGQHPPDIGYVINGFVDGFGELLREPAVLDTYLNSIQPRPAGNGYLFPGNVSDMMERILGTLVLLGDCQLSPDEVSAICRRISTTQGPIGLEQISMALKDVGSSSNAPELARKLASIKLWRHRGGGQYEFSHFLWHDYFRSLALWGSHEWRSIDSLANWIASAPDLDLRAMLPFLCGLTNASPLQGALYDALLHRDVQLYLHALRYRAPTPRGGDTHDWMRQCLSEISRGYFQLVERLAPRLKSFLVPWYFSGDREATMKPIVSGFAEDGYLSYYFGFAEPNGPDIRIETYVPRGQMPAHAPSNGVERLGLDVAWSAEGEDSGRLISARYLIDQLKKIATKSLFPPIGWLAREQFRLQARELAYEFEWKPGWERWSVAIISQRVARVLQKFRTEHSDVTDLAVGGVSVNDFLKLAEVLVADGHADEKVSRLGLPGPDRRLGRSPRFADAYSTKRKVERLKVLYRSVVDTYRLICETYLGEARPYLSFATFPIRAVVQIDSEGSVMTLQWELVETWEAADPIIEITDSQPSDRALDNEYHKARMNCRQFGRKFVEMGFSWTRADRFWVPWREVVTDEVYKLLQEDFKRLALWLTSPMKRNGN